MKILKKIYQKLTPSFDTEEHLRTDFKAKYYHFRQLLNANRTALEIMAEMEEALRGTRPFGMKSVRVWCTKVSTNLFQIVRSLNELTPGRYEDLYEQFDQIRENVNLFVHPRSAPKKGPLVLPLQDVDKEMADDVGAKMAYIGEIRNRLQLEVPNGFVVTARGYERFMEHNELQAEIDRRIQTAPTDRLDQLFRLSASIQLLISMSAKVPKDLEETILEQYRRVKQEAGEEVTMAVRSSALGEDAHGVSFAGQYRSILNVGPEGILQAYKDIVASKYGLPAMAYRLNRGIRDEDVVMCVGYMTMENPVSGGVAYSRNPVNIRDDSIIINSVWGLPKSVVDGTTPSDLFIVSRGAPLVIREKEIAFKERKAVGYCPEGITCMDMTAPESQMPSLNDEKVLDIARMAVRLEAYAGTPQDIEWAVRKDGSVILLQCRPLQQIDVAEVDDSKGDLEGQPTSVLLRGGVTVSPGVAAGPVFVVKNNVDALQFPNQAVLVAAQALPSWAALLNQAAAIITQQGNIAGHLATVAREFSVPALFGVRGAIDALKNGQCVTVDADSRTVHEGRIDALLDRAEEPKNLMEGSPVLATLKAACQHIIPLYLLDPEAPEFNPRSCKTFHDITRFCHEKVLEEMFRFGKDHRLFERSGKELICDLPMTYWLINLDDGLREDVNADRVLLENVVSVPMLAFWQGLAAVPWEAPPRVRSGGLMSAFMEATMNPALEPSRASRLAARNYCMISKDFCILQLRFNFHFCTVESLVGERTADNYIIFHFKGGAANLQRRMFRARLVAEVLEAYDFQTEAKEDAAFAELRGYDQAFTEERLKILGYLVMHTRQLDMAMSDPASLNHYKAKILKGMEELVAH